MNLQTLRATVKSKQISYPVSLVRTDTISQQSLDFQDIFKKYYGHILKIAYQMLRRRDLAEDATQEVFMRAYKNVSMVSSEIQLLAWLRRVTINFCLDELRRRKAIQIEPCVDFDAKNVHGKFINFPQASPEDIINTKESIAVIDKILQSLPPHYCQVLLMKYVDELSYKDIAYAMDATVASIRSMIFRARKQFIKLYVEFTGDVSTRISSSDR